MKFMVFLATQDLQLNLYLGGYFLYYFSSVLKHNLLNMLKVVQLLYVKYKAVTT